MDPPIYPFEETSFMDGPLLVWISKADKVLSQYLFDLIT